MFDRRTFLATTAAGAALASARGASAATMARVAVEVNTRERIGDLPHVWEECVGSDRAAITLREEWRDDLRRGVAEAGFKRVRFHGIFNDELGVFGRDIMAMQRKDTGPNWLNLFRVYDGLIANKVAPFIELGFMPSRLASGTRTFGFYNANITPPKSDVEYGAFIKGFTAALVDRYGIEAVREWPFEVWNEPNLAFFWSGDKQRYFDMYKAAATAIKSVDPRLKVGGPATSKTAWLGDFAAWSSANNVPVDFVATHVYAGDNQKEVFGDGPTRSINDVIPDAIAQARRLIDSGPLANKPLWLSEWSSDSPAMIVHTIANTMQHCAGLSQWTLSGMYEELGVDNYMLKEGSMGWPMMISGIARPSFNTYRLLHRLGMQRLAAKGPALASRTAQGKTSVLVWNLAEVAQPGGIPGMTADRNVRGETKTIDLTFSGVSAGKPVTVSYVDWERGSPLPAWRAMGSPQYPKPDQIAALRRASQPVSERLRLSRQSTLSLVLPPEGLALVEFD
ncbi:xylan 1,4-beta-xylosidase [Novosphingobium chloroacetimidivorans]|uniref:Xylan 1,4-beta-xylosidase n=1 Tax=Novosphingobium chloroacetimidivorans TaxID=1428314 RepID=A0A7W7K9X4_9SPHN|nr:glycosyl hydrolase [Novosphingobium chloroacetimidivorans]MBB4858895.1 xylan 1,4-beta-xylosidase [Novosphingobium chloroacetimidivorans]